MSFDRIRFIDRKLLKIWLLANCFVLLRSLVICRQDGGYAVLLQYRRQIVISIGLNLSERYSHTHPIPASSLT